MNIRATPNNEAARIALDIYERTLDAVRGDILVSAHLPQLEPLFAIAGRIFVCGAGKASVAMASGC